ncbi:MAG: hypothetical protein A2Y15_04430 [Clostridiales bacterium GWF2_36_10]|nr:MAG: hypothetical protein A2Y15_04430 [Clostridiales bacterium GWF2_36_10]HAN20658.1 hypothetical protein [Clostridiales bacterium]
MRTFKIILCNLNIIFAGVFITFQILDLYNPTMNFMGNSLIIILLFTFCLLSILNASLLLVRNHKIVNTYKKTNNTKFK